MSNVAIFKLGETPQYLTSVNTPDYADNPDCLINPDISAVKAVPIQYWKREKDKIVEMTLAEKEALDQSILDKIKNDVGLTTNEAFIVKAGNDYWSAGKTISADSVVELIKTSVESN